MAEFVLDAEPVEEPVGDVEDEELTLKALPEVVEDGEDKESTFGGTMGQVRL